MHLIVRVPACLAIGASLLLLTGWTTKAVSTPRPTCSAADTRAHKTRVVGRGAHHAPLDLRYCGPARGVIDLDGRSYAIRGGWCRHVRNGPGENENSVAIGLIANPPAAPGRGISLRLPLRAGRIRIDDSEFEVPGRRVAASGIVTVGTRLTSGTFNVYGRTAAGPTGIKLIGSWTCR
jgi:hypothetical protein